MFKANQNHLIFTTSITMFYHINVILVHRVFLIDRHNFVIDLLESYISLYSKIAIEPNDNRICSTLYLELSFKFYFSEIYVLVNSEGGSHFPCGVDFSRTPSALLTAYFILKVIHWGSPWWNQFMLISMQVSFFN